MKLLPLGGGGRILLRLVLRGSCRRPVAIFGEPKFLLGEALLYPSRANRLSREISGKGDERRTGSMFSLICALTFVYFAS